jgi:hypothetical protein
MTITLRQCQSCRNDFYNGHNELGVKRCWSAKDGKIVVRYRIGVHTLPTQPGAFTKVKVPDCYHCDGYEFYQSLPTFVRARDVVRSKRNSP